LFHLQEPNSSFFLLVIHNTPYYCWEGGGGGGGGAQHTNDDGFLTVEAKEHNLAADKELSFKNLVDRRTTTDTCFVNSIFKK